MRPRILYSVYNISGYLVAELAELAKVADIIVMERPCCLSDGARERLGAAGRWIDRDKLQSPEDAFQALQGVLPDVYICGGWSDPVYFGLAKMLHWKGVTTVVSIDTPWEGKFRQVVHCLMSRFYLTPVFDYAWGAGEPQERYLRYLGFPQKRIRRGTYCADVQKFSPIGAEKVEKLGGGGQRTWPHTFLYVGRYVAVKNMRRMERAFLEAIEQMPESDWTLRCIGGGELWDERTIHPKIEHLGYKGPEEIQNYVKEAGCFVLPSLYEPWGVVVHEAALMALPMICSDQIQAASAFLRCGVNGLAFDPCDEDALTEAFVKVMRMKDDALMEMGRQSLALGRSHTLEDWAKTVMEFYDENH